MATYDKVVLVTGASGHIRFQTLVFLLQHGYQTKIVLRSLSRVDEIRNNASIKALNVVSTYLAVILGLIIALILTISKSSQALLISSKCPT